MPAAAAKSILEYFSKPSFYAGQKEALLEIEAHYSAGYKAVILEGPTGTGKSAIAEAIAEKYGAYVNTSQKTLQTQYERDFPGMGVLRGRNAYSCDVIHGYADVAPCVEYGEKAEIRCSLTAKGGFRSDGKTVHCPYAAALARATETRVSLFNYHVFFAHRASTLPRTEEQIEQDLPPTLRFPMRGISVMDECHGLESIAMGLVQVTIDNTYMPLAPETSILGLIPKLQKGGDYRTALEETLDQMALDISSMDPGPPKTKLFRSMQNLATMLRRIAFTCGLYNRTKVEDYDGVPFENQWLMQQENVPGQKRPHTIHLKPVFAGPFVPGLFLRKGQRVLFMSATVLSKEIFCSTIGIKPEDAAYVSIPCHFPVENRLVHVYPCGDLSYKKFDQGIPKVIQGIKRILEIHKGQRGIIHTHSWRVLKAIKDGVKDSRLIFQDAAVRNREDFIDMLKESKDGVLVAPAMREGLDLKDDWSRFQILVKVPWPDFGDPQIKARVELDEKWCVWMTAISIVQSSGRSVRSVTDYASTYLLDAGFTQFYNRSRIVFGEDHKMRSLLPQWFVDALRIYSSDEAEAFLAGKELPCKV